jgi:hypothetical protein
MMVGGEGSGKSLVGGMELISRCFEGTLFWLVGADYDNTKPEFDYIAEAANKLGILEFASTVVNPGKIVLKGGITISTISAKDPRNISKFSPHGIVVCEAAQCDFQVIQRLIARLGRAGEGGWMLMTGTFEGSLGWYPEVYLSWQGPNKEDGKSFSLASWTNTALYPGGRDDPLLKKIEATMSPDLFNERMGGVPCPPSGRVFHEFRNSLHVLDKPFDPEREVEICVDPGYSAGWHAVEAGQWEGDYFHLIDEVYEQFKTSEQMISICRMKPWWKKVTGGSIDIAGTAHKPDVPASEIWKKSAGVHLRAKKVPIAAGIERMRTYLIPDPITHRPHLTINPRCQGIISEFGGCPHPVSKRTEVYQYDTDRNGVVIGVKDSNNHGIKAVTYEIVCKFGYTRPQTQSQSLVRRFG